MKCIDENKLDGLYDNLQCCMCTNPMRSDRGCDGCCDVDGLMYGNICHVIQDFLTNAKIEAEPVRHGHWINANYGRHYICSVCTRIYETYGFDYCPSCGAKMDGVTEVKKDEV